MKHWATLLFVIVLLVAGCTAPGTGGEATTVADGAVQQQGDLSLSSPVFSDGGPIPDRYTCDGEDIHPQLSIGGVPAGAETLVVIVDDPDAPSGTFTHWTVWGIAPDRTNIAAGADVGVDGTNGFGNVGYDGPCPPRGGEHRYRFKLFALDSTLDIAAGADRATLEAAMEGHVIAATQLTGTYARS